MAEYIKRETAIDIVKSGGYWEREDREVAVACIEQTPTADVEEVKHGEWKPFFENVEIYNSGGFTERKQTGWKCNKCKNFEYMKCNYCSKCGAKMDGGKAE